MLTGAAAAQAKIVNQERPMESSGSQLGLFLKAVAFAAVELQLLSHTLAYDASNER